MTKTEAQIAPSVKKSKRVLYTALAIGLVLGLYFGFASANDPSSFDLFSNSDISPIVAAIGIAVWLIIVPPLTLVWWRTVDEHEKDAYREGAMVSSHVYLFLVPSWWLAARAGWVPAQDPMIVLLIVSLIWSAVWLYRKYV